jgi:hypothetical protein
MRSTRMRAIRLVIAGGLIAFVVVMWLQSRVERFMNIGDIDSSKVSDIDLSKIPDPHTVFKRIRAILDRYDDPATIHQITSNIDKDPGELARQHLGIQNRESANSTSSLTS